MKLAALGPLNKSQESDQHKFEEYILSKMVQSATSDIKAGLNTTALKNIQRAHDAYRWLSSPKDYYFISEFRFSSKKGYYEHSYKEWPIIPARYCFEFFGLDQDYLVKKFLKGLNPEDFRFKWRAVKGDYTMYK